jgi:DNA replication protein DnaC
MNITDKARGILAQHGVDIDQLGDAPPVDISAILMENATAAYDAFIPEEFVDACIENPEVADWIERFLAGTSVPPLLMLGHLGTGKSSHAYAAVRECLFGRARQRRTLSWHMTSYAKFNAAMRPTSDDSHLASLANAEQVELLVLDDLGAGISTDWTADTLYRLVDERWARHRATIVTTNYTPEQLEQKVDPRVVSRLASGRVVRLKGRDRRFTGGRP